MTYTIRNISDFCDVDFGFVTRIINSNELRPTKIYGNANEKKGYSFYQMFIIKQFIEQLIQKDIFFDFDKEEVFTVYESRMNYETN